MGSEMCIRDSLKADNPQGLQKRYHGPHMIKRRLGDTTLEVKTGTYKSGGERLEVHSWNNAKPAHMSEGMKAIDRPKLGRPAAERPEEKVPPPPSSEADSKLTVKVNKPVSKQPAASSHQMTLRNQNKNITSIEAANSNYERLFPETTSWSASSADLAAINAAISTDRRKHG